jgi:serine/threonine-protein kinase
LRSAVAATASPTATSVPRAPVAARRAGSGAADHGRFLPGTMLAGRYRIVGLLGRGGMGEVYRADDVKLGQAVALKFLPAAVEKDEGRLARFMNEVKVARQISHTNVCRVYDVGDVDGHHFLSMEYVDGEDLSTLLRRIGRLPKDKAVQIARELCAGLAAAHDQGILHRDLKPANIMIDGRGRARITDFGLAGLAAEIGTDTGAGTPGYMAPEQLAGRASSIKSDLYALGLVLYELFTGKPAFHANTLPELLRVQTETTPTSPSRIVEGFDPAVERVILRCLEKEPRDRPSSALAIAAALPGGNPLAAALAAGETPSPELVAEAGDVGGLAPPLALACLATIVAAVVGVIALSGSAQLTRVVSPEKPPDALVERARETLHKLGDMAPPFDSVHGFHVDDRYLDYIADHDATASRWDRLKQGEPPVLLFWYRQSPRYLVPQNYAGTVSLTNPPSNVSGMSTVILDPRGRLRRLERVPPETDDAWEPAVEPDWSPLFQASELDLATLKPAKPVWFPPFFVDHRAAWDGTYPGATDVPIHVEAAAYRGMPVFFMIATPWSLPERMQVSPVSLAGKISQAAGLSVFLSILVGGCVLARANLRLGRGDRKGAFRLAAYMMAVQLVGSFLATHHVPESAELRLFILNLARALYVFSLYWVFYIALEPHVRRLWPHIIVSWVRLLNGRFRDPLVGRDVLIGVAAGTVLSLWGRAFFATCSALGSKTANPATFFSWSDEVSSLSGLRGAVWRLLELATAPAFTFYLLIILLLLRLILRKPAPAYVAYLAVGILINATAISTGNIPLGLVFLVLLGTAWTVLMVRFGIVAMMAMLFTSFALDTLPMTFDFSAWYAYGTLLALGAILALAGFAFHSALAGRPVFGDEKMGSGLPISSPP